MPVRLTVRALAAGALGRSGASVPLSRALARVAGGYILAFHNLPTARFVEHIESLCPDRPVPLDELIDRHVRGEATGGLFAITFDDGIGDTVRSIATVARARQWPVSFYVPTGYVDDPVGMPFQWLKVMQPYLPRMRLALQSGVLDLAPPGAVAEFVARMRRAMYTGPRASYASLLLELKHHLVERGLATAEALEAPPAITWAEIAALSRDPLLRFESHGISHVALVTLSASELEEELRRSRDVLSERTGRRCRHFCYPYGGRESIGDAAPVAVARLYTSAVTMSRGRLRRHAPNLLPRIPLYPEDSPGVARLKTLTI